MSDRIMNSRKPRRRLAPSEKYEIFVSVLTGQATQREAAEKWTVDRSTVVHICRTAKQGALGALSASVPGRPGMSAEQAALAEARAELGLLRATVTEQAVAQHLREGKAGWTDGWPGPGPRGRLCQGRPARPGRSRRRGRLVRPAGVRPAGPGSLAGGPLAGPPGGRLPG